MQKIIDYMLELDYSYDQSELLYEGLSIIILMNPINKLENTMKLI